MAGPSLRLDYLDTALQFGHTFLSEKASNVLRLDETVLVDEVGGRQPEYRVALCNLTGSISDGWIVNTDTLRNP
jgi:hypothetical protein